MKRSCHECFSKFASKTVAAQGTVRVAEIWIRTTVCKVEVQVMTSSKRRTKRVTSEYGIPCDKAVPSCLPELYGCPSWHVYQREQKGLWIVPIEAIRLWIKNRKNSAKRLGKASMFSNAFPKTSYSEIRCFALRVLQTSKDFCFFLFLQLS